jgi:putative ubiquitin-RnfH superfamily antitoxin RatB of RatAB toxin-antitoxin module
MDRVETHPSVVLAPAPAANEWVSIEVVHAAEGGTVGCVRLRLRLGATVADALHAAGWSVGAESGPSAGRPSQVPGAEPARELGADWRLSVWGRWVGFQHVLRERDRLEILRPLRVDPKEARRQRHAQHRARLERLKPAGQRRRPPE